MCAGEGCLIPLTTESSSRPPMALYTELLNRANIVTSDSLVKIKCTLPSSVCQVILAPNYYWKASLLLRSTNQYMQFTNVSRISIFFLTTRNHCQIQRFSWMILDLQSKRIKKIPSSGILFAGWWLFLLRCSLQWSRSLGAWSRQCLLPLATCH